MNIWTLTGRSSIMIIQIKDFLGGKRGQDRGKCKERGERGIQSKNIHKRHTVSPL